VLQHKLNTHLLNFGKFMSYLSKAIDLKTAALNKKIKSKFSKYKLYKFLRRYFKKLISLPRIFYLKLLYVKDKVNHLYFFKRIYKYRAYKKNIKYKNKIPIYIWVESI
jgi:hypothetical protein